jgi:hypothetical protein
METNEYCTWRPMGTVHGDQCVLYMETKEYCTWRPMVLCMKTNVYCTWRPMGIVHEDQCTLLTTCSILLKMRNFSYKLCTENRKTIHDQYFFLNRAVYEIMWENTVQPDNMAHAHCTMDTFRLQAYTQNTSYLLLSTATMVARKRLNVRLIICNVSLVIIYVYVWVRASDTNITAVSVIIAELSSIVEMLGVITMINSRPLIEPCVSLVFILASHKYSVRNFSVSSSLSDGSFYLKFSRNSCSRCKVNYPWS